MASSVLSNATMLKMAIATTMGQVPPFQVISSDAGDEAKATEVVVNGEETDPIVTNKASTHFYLVEFVTFFAVISGFLSFYFVVNQLLVDFMSACVMLLAPVVAVQRHKLRELGGSRVQHNLLRGKVGQLHTENEALASSVAALTAQTAKLKQVQEGLQSVVTTSGTSVDTLVATVEENGKIQKEILENLKSQVMQQIMTSVLQIDRDRNFIISAQEVEVLVARLKNIPGVVLDEASFLSFIKSDTGELTLPDVCEIARHLHDGDQKIVTPANDKLHHNDGPAVASNESKSIDTAITTSRIMVASSPVFSFNPKDLLNQKRR